MRCVIARTARPLIHRWRACARAHRGNASSLSRAIAVPAPTEVADWFDVVHRPGWSWNRNTTEGVVERSVTRALVAFSAPVV